MVKILFTTPVLEYPAAGGPQLRIENSIKALNKVAELHVICRETKTRIGSEVAEKHYRALCHSFSYSPSTYYVRKTIEILIRRFLKICKIIFKIDTSFLLGKIESKRETMDAEYIIRYAKEHLIDVIWFGYGNISYDLMKTIKAKAPNLRIVCDTDSVWSRFILRELPYEFDAKRRKKIEENGKKKEREEADWVNSCDVTTAVSDVDADYYKHLAKDKNRIKIFSNVIDLDAYKNKPPKAKEIKNPCIYIAGSFGPKSPMEKAARWIIEEIFPIIIRDMPGINLYIVGKGSDTTLSDVKNDSIIITGKLGSVLPYLCYADVALVPLFFESGTRFKILEAAACGIPIVSTTLGAEGLIVIPEEDILIADEPQTFARAIIRIIKDKNFAHNMASNCKAKIEKRYSIDALVEEAREILASLGA